MHNKRLSMTCVRLGSFHRVSDTCLRHSTFNIVATHVRGSVRINRRRCGECNHVRAHTHTHTHTHTRISNAGRGAVTVLVINATRMAQPKSGQRNNNQVGRCTAEPRQRSPRSTHACCPLTACIARACLLCFQPELFPMSLFTRPSKLSLRRP